ncbi:MAG: ABC transporter permease [Deltaproteobacteria bacterium]|nr:ABC transporter permease [Deltaproteobacteria bacterium]
MLRLFSLISLPRIRRAPLRSLLVVLGIALGVATLLAMTLVNRSVLGAFHESIERVAGRATLVVSNGEAGVPADLIDALAERPEVAHAAGAIELTVLRAGAPGRGPVLLLGIDFLNDLHFAPLDVEGEGEGEGEGGEGADAVDDPLSIANDPNAVLISRALAVEEGLALGGSLTVLTPSGPRDLVVRGLLGDSGLAASFGGAVAVMFLDAAQQAFERGDRVDRIDIALAPGVELVSAREALRAVVGHRGRVEPPEGRLRQIARLFDPIARSLDLSGTLAILIGMFLIYNAVGIAVAERRREIGILRAVGLPRRKVTLLFALEAAFLGVLGGGLGVLLGRVIAAVALSQSSSTVSRFYAPIRPADPEIDPLLVLVGLAIGSGAAFLAALRPARGAARVDPIETMRDASPRAPRRPLPLRAMAVAGLILLPAAAWVSRWTTELAGFLAIGLVVTTGVLCVPAGIIAVVRAARGLVERSLGVPGRIGVDNLAASIRPSTITVSALMLAVGLGVGMSAWAASLESAMMRWLDRALPADVYITAGSPVADNHNMPFSGSALERAASVPGVRKAYGLSSVTLDVRDLRLQLLALDLATYFLELDAKGMAPIVTSGPDRIDPRRLLERPGVLIGEATARGLRLRPGDHLALDTPTGAQEVEVIAVIVDYSSVQGTMMIDRRWYQSWFHDTRIDTIDLFLGSDASPDLVAAEVRRRLGGDASLYVVSAAELRHEFRAALGEALAIFHAVDLVAMWVALLGVIGSMLAAILGRTREIGVLRAIGGTRAQVERAVITEAALLGLSAAIIGTIFGVPLGWILVRVIGLVNTGWQIDYLFPLAGSLRLALAVTAAAAFAGLLSARRAARVDVSRALTEVS